ncbi:MAG: alpha/beta hydrolase fold domain-containing protein [Candidatus Parcubacteria bacterium]|nr:alpha/beta hydrolase fold domain-containing protein [Burkholderiales bacterium]
MSQALETIEIETGAAPVAAVIWLHGLGADGHDFEPIVPELNLPASKPVRFIFPNAPHRPVTINNGMRMPAWYDIVQLGGGAEDEAGIREAQASLENLISREMGRGIAPGKIVLAGFSQGGAIVLQTALRQRERLGGVMALSTYLPLAEALAAERQAPNHDLPVFMAHGLFDNMIPLQRAASSRDTLQALGYQVEWHEYPMPHSVCPEEIADIAAFLLRVL